MSLSSDRLIPLKLTTDNAISELLQGWQDWLDLGLISELDVNTQINGLHSTFKLNLTTTIQATDLLTSLQTWQTAGLLSNNTQIALTVNVKASHPALLTGLDQWLQRGLLNHAEVRRLSQQYLTSPLPVVVPSLNISPPVPSPLPVTPKPSKPRKKRRQTRRIGQMVQSLMAELSVIWLLLLGVFMVVISSGVLAASWWETFPAVLQYGILWLYTLAFGVGSWWTGKQANLRLTTQALRTVTLLLVPINFFAMDSFPLWYTVWGLLGMMVGSLSLTALTLKIFQTNSESSNTPLPLLNHLTLTYLHWGWTLPGIPLIATYIGVIGTTILTLFSPHDTRPTRKFLPFSLTEAIIIYALVILLIRAIFMAHVNIFQLGLAVALCGWLMGWRSPPQTPWKWVGSSLLCLGWLLSVFTYPLQAIAVSFLAILWLGKRLKNSWLRRDFGLIFLIGLQIPWLIGRLSFLSGFFEGITQFTGTQSNSLVLLSLGLFPYLILIVLSRKFFIRIQQNNLSQFSGKIALYLGIGLTIISLVNPLFRTLNLVASTLILGYVTQTQIPRHRASANLLALTTHSTGLLGILSIISYCLPTLTISLWGIIFLGLMLLESLFSFSNFPDNSLFSLLNKSAWGISLVFSSVSYSLFWYNLPFVSPFWGLSWLIVPLLLTAIATWYLPRRQLASELSVVALSMMQGLTIFFPQTRLIGVITSTGLMFINTRYLRHWVSATFTVGFGLSVIAVCLYPLKLSPQLWILSGVIVTGILWLIRHSLADNSEELAFLYTKVFDTWGYSLSLTCLGGFIYFASPDPSTTNNLISSILLMITAAYRSWQPSSTSNKFPLWYSVLILIIAPIPALTLPSWGWIELAIATLLMIIQTQLIKQVIAAAITIGLGLGLISAFLESIGLIFYHEFSINWLLIGAITIILLWSIRHLFNRQQVSFATYYNPALDGWAMTLFICDFSTIALLNKPVNNPVILALTLGLIMIGTTYRSLQTPRTSPLLWLSVITILLVQVLMPNLGLIRIISLGIGTGLLFIHTVYLKKIFAAFLTVGIGLSCLILTLWQGVEEWQINSVSIWLLVNILTLISLWLLWSYLKQKSHPLARIYTTAIDGWGIISCSFGLVALTLHSIAIYWQYLSPSLGSIIAAFLLLGAIIYRSWHHPTNWTIYTLGWSLELLTIEVLGLLESSLFILAIANIILGLCIQFLGAWWHRHTGEQNLLSSWHILPLLYGALGTALRWNFFSSFTGLTSLGLALIIMGIGRRRARFKPLIYVAIAVFSWSAYELLWYQIYPLPLGDNLLSMAALATTIMYVYRLTSAGLSSYLNLSQQELKVIAHLHWILGTIFLGISLLYPVTTNQLIGLGAGIFLSQYAILEGRRFSDAIYGEIWVYLGLIQGGTIAAYAALTIPSPNYLDYFFERWIGTAIALFGVVVYSLPWQQWGWSKKPWNLLAYSLPLIGVITNLSSLNSITLLVAAICYGILAKMSYKPRLLYLSLILVNGAIIEGFKLVYQFSISSYSILFGLSLLSIIWIEPNCQGEEGKELRHFLRLTGTGIISVVSLLFYSKIGILPGIMSIILIFLGLSLQIRAFLFTGTITFLINGFYQLVVLSLTYPLLKWIIGLFVGLMFIWIAASFENRRSQFSTLIRHWIREFEAWD
ncbi:hypothetical protein VB715_12905 [Crocosphaera sp. UHCC 0190]|uniref:hypothetical protein n=1 Tax=Crocosphaera sp. UHCC 0190 TaxID=3110246 RepID=UPI002B2007FA|nr:hypothetical protein [Crocosphaera sp. UHCC 0190]MEA5510665.1 hypothetical protein [Crocosphaera sp. UHCC 0190]